VSCPRVRGNLPSGFRVKISENNQILSIGIVVSGQYLYAEINQGAHVD